MGIIYYTIGKFRGMFDYALNKLMHYRNADTPINKNISQIDMTIINIKLTRDKIKEKIHNYEFKETEYRSLAKKALKENNKTKAKHFLQLSKLNKIEVDHLMNMLSTLIEQINMIEKAKIEADALKILDEGNRIIKEIQLNVEKFQQIKDDMNELKENNQQLSNFFNDFKYNENEFIKDIDSELEKLQSEYFGGNKLTESQSHLKEIEEIQESHNHSLIQQKEEDKELALA